VSRPICTGVTKGAVSAEGVARERAGAGRGATTSISRDSFNASDSAAAPDAHDMPYRAAQATNGPAGSFIEWRRTAERVC
jgi:hypothetical protein